MVVTGCTIDHILQCQTCKATLLAAGGHMPKEQIHIISTFSNLFWLIFVGNCPTLDAVVRAFLRWCFVWKYHCWLRRWMREKYILIFLKEWSNFWMEMYKFWKCIRAIHQMMEYLSPLKDDNDRNGGILPEEETLRQYLRPILFCTFISFYEITKKVELYFSIAFWRASLAVL